MALIKTLLMVNHLGHCRLRVNALFEKFAAAHRAAESDSAASAVAYPVLRDLGG
jgi:hypothetical protein